MMTPRSETSEKRRIQIIIRFSQLRDEITTNERHERMKKRQERMKKRFSQLKQELQDDSSNII